MFFHTYAAAALTRRSSTTVSGTVSSKGRHYAEWKAEQSGKPTVREIIRADMDAIIGQAYTYDSFLMLLRKNGYEVRRNPNRKYTTVKPPGAKRTIRLDSLGKGYTEADILARLSRQRHNGVSPPVITYTPQRSLRAKPPPSISSMRSCPDCGSSNMTARIW